MLFSQLEDVVVVGTGHTFIRSDHHIGTANGILIYDSIRITEVF